MDTQYTKVKAAITDVLEDAQKYPKRILTEADLETWIQKALIHTLDIGNEDSLFGVHAQARFLDSYGELKIIADLVVFRNDEYTLDEDAGLTKRKGFTASGSSIVIEIKFGRGCRRIGMTELLEDIDKLSEIRDLHYSNEKRDL